MTNSIPLILTLLVAAPALALERGDILVTTDTEILRIDPVSGTPTVLCGGFDNLRGISQHGDGSVVVAGASDVWKVDLDTCVQEQLSSANGQRGVVVRGENDVHYASDELAWDFLTDDVFRASGDRVRDHLTGTTIFSGGNLHDLDGIAYDPLTGNTWVTDQEFTWICGFMQECTEPRELIRITPGGQQTAMAINQWSGSAPGVAPDGNGKVLVTDTLGGRLLRINPGNGIVMELTADLDSPRGVLPWIPACSDGRQGDGDGMMDMLDPGCDDEDDSSEQSAFLPCDDGIDWNNNSLADSVLPGELCWLSLDSEPGCTDPADPDELNECWDGRDNDLDGKWDACPTNSPDPVPPGWVCPSNPNWDPDCKNSGPYTRENGEHVEPDAACEPIGDGDGGCGLGLGFHLLPVLAWWRRRTHAN